MRGIVLGLGILICLSSFILGEQAFLTSETADPVLFHDLVTLDPLGSFSINESTNMEVKGLYGNLTTYDNVSLIICPEWWLEEILNRSTTISFYEIDFVEPGPWNYIIGNPDDNRTNSIALRNNNNYVIEVELWVFQDTTPPNVSISHRIHTLFPASVEIEIQAYDSSYYNYRNCNSYR